MLVIQLVPVLSRLFNNSLSTLGRTSTLPLLSYDDDDDDDGDDDDDNDDENNDDDGLAMGVVKGARRPRLNAISACNIPNDASNYDSKLAYNLGLKHSCEP